MAKGSKTGNAKLVAAAPTVSWAVSSAQFRKLAGTGEFAREAPAPPPVEGRRAAGEPTQQWQNQ